MKRSLLSSRLFSIAAALFSVTLLLGMAGCKSEEKTKVPDSNTGGETDTTAPEGDTVDPVVPPAEKETFENIDIDETTDSILGDELTPPADDTTGAGDTSMKVPSLMRAQSEPLYGADKVPLPPIGDLEPQIEKYIKKFTKDMDDLDGTVNYASDAESIFRDATTLKLIALAIGLSDSDSKYKKVAPAIMEACDKLTESKTFAQGKAAIAQLEKAKDATGGDLSGLSWEKKNVKMAPAMKAVPNINSALKRYFRSEALLKRGYENVFEGTAGMAVLAQGCIPNVDETIAPDKKDDWEKECKSFRDTLIEFNKLVHDLQDGKGNFNDVKKAFSDIDHKCESCHEHFTSGVAI